MTEHGRVPELARVADTLATRGIAATVEYPAWLNVPVDKNWSLACGFANAPDFDADLVSDDGDVIDGWRQEPNEDRVDFVVACVRRAKASLRQRGIN